MFDIMLINILDGQMTVKGNSLKESYYHQKMDPLKSIVRLEAAVNTLLLQC